MISGVRSHWISTGLFTALILCGSALTGCSGEEKAEVSSGEAVETPIKDDTPTKIKENEGPASMDVVVRIGGSPYQYIPREISVSPGQKVTWINATDSAHTLTPDPGNPEQSLFQDPIFSRNLPAGGTLTWNVPENTPTGIKGYYHCNFHGKPGDGKTPGTGMVGIIHITPKDLQNTAGGSDGAAENTTGNAAEPR